MNSSFGIVTLAAALVSAPAFGSALLPTGRQDVSRLTLLRGPYLTSPAKPAPQPATIRAFPPTPGPLMTAAPASTLKLGSSAEQIPEFAPAAKLSTPPNPKTLRFDSQLPSSTKPSLLTPGSRETPRQP